MSISRWIRLTSFAVALAATTGCIYEESIVGPAPEPNRITVAAVAGASGSVAVLLPEVPNYGVMEPPGVDCYLAEVPANGEWEVMAEGYSTGAPYCTLSLDSGTWVARAYQVPAGWTALWIVTW